MGEMKKFLVVLLVAVLAGASLGLMLRPKQDKSGMVTVTLVVEQYRQGKLINRVIEEKDPFNQNFVNLLTGLLTNCGGVSEKTWSMTDTGGTARTFYLAHDPINYAYIDLVATGNAILIGSGTTSFSISDYKLATQVASAASSSPTESIIGNSINITISASFSISSAVTISEVGYARNLYDSSGNTRTILLMRDVLSTPINAAAGDTVTVNYIIRING